MENGQSSKILVEDFWVCLGGDKVLWLPPELRGPTCHDIKNNILAFGYGNGRVLIIKFCAPSD
ncbi:hypothetical protein BDW72DRAFT_187503 [Aspergillus terricola var. indicus]